MNSQDSVTVPRDLEDIGREHREQLLRWVAQTGISMVGLVGLLYGPGVALGWNHHVHLGAAPGQGGALAVPALTACVVAAATWLMFSLRYALATRVGAVLLAAAGLVVAVPSAATPIPGAPVAGHPEPVVSVLALITLLGICAVVYLSAPSPVRPDTRDPALPELSWMVALPFYLLTYAVAFSAMFSSLDLSDSVFAGGGNLLSAIQYAIAVLGFALAGIVRSRAPAVWAPLAGVTAVVVCLPLAVGAPLLAAATAHPDTRPVIDLALLVVLIPALLWLARHRTATRLLCPATTAAATAATGEPTDEGDVHDH